MDQFRGYTVAGMFVVNFVGGLAAMPAILKHHNVYFSYADTIMPSFMFACGFSYRLSMLRREAQIGWAAAARHMIRRSLGLILVSLVVFGLGSDFGEFSEMTRAGVWKFVARLLKADMWEVLAIIGAAQVLLLPVVTRGVLVRVLAMAGLLVGHFLLSWWFNYDFVHGKPNVLDPYWGEAGRAWDGGFFGVMMWAVPMLGGSLAYDLVTRLTPRNAAAWLLVLGMLLMAKGYAVSCLTRLYDLPEGLSTAEVERIKNSPMIPPLDRAKGRAVADLLAEPPFVPPPPDEERAPNYWRMDKRIVGPSFILFSMGFAAALYGVFVIACDIGSMHVGLFRTLGQNPLAAYVIHHAVEHTVLQVVPKDSPLWWCLVGLGVFYLISYSFVRYLEKQRIYIRL